MLIVWQAYRGDQRHRKNNPTQLQTQIQVKKKKHLPGLYTFKTRLTADFGQTWILEKHVRGRQKNLKFGMKHGWWSIRAPSKFQVKSIITS